MRILALLAAVLVLAAPAAAASTPRFALYDLRDLAAASKNDFGDVQASKRAPKAPEVVRCAAGCRFGAGWIGFRHAVGPTGAEVVSADVVGSAKRGFFLEVGLSARGAASWRSFARLEARRIKHAGVPDVLVVAVGGRVLAAPYATDVRLVGSRLELYGFTRAGARAAASALAG